MYASFSGNIGRDAEVIATKSGKYLLKFSVADEVYANGQKQTQWVSCVDFRTSSVEKLVDYLKKGTLVHVSGEVSLNSYEAKDGTTKTSLQCSVTGIRLHGSKSSEGKSKSVASEGTQAVPLGDDDIPF